MTKQHTIVILLGVVLALLGLGTVVAPYVYIHFVESDPPKPLRFETTHSSTRATSTNARSASRPAGVDGTWSVADGSTVGYRVNELLFGQKNTAVGRTTTATGHLSIAGNTVHSADFTVDVASLRSDNLSRDGTLVRTLATATFPTAAFTLTTPITLARIPANLQQIAVPVVGKLTLHGVTKTVTFPLAARRNDPKIEVNGSIPITLSDFSISSPSQPGIAVADNGRLEFLLTFARRTTPTDRVPGR